MLHYRVYRSFTPRNNLVKYEYFLFNFVLKITNGKSSPIAGSLVLILEVFIGYLIFR